MHQQNDMNHPSASSSSYYDNYQSHFQNPIPNSPLDHFHSTANPSAPPDPSIYYSSDHSSNYSSSYNSHHHQNQVAQNFDYTDSPGYDSNSIPSSYYSRPYSQIQSQYQTAVSYGGDTNDGGVYAYDGGNNGRQSESSRVPAITFDDYGRPIAFGAGGEYVQRGSMEGLDSKIVKASPKVEVNEDARSGVQKFRVKLLSEGAAGHDDMDVLCQIGLDGIRILDSATTRILKIYPLETVTRWEVLDSSIFAFWTKSSIDIDARRIRLKSNSYTTTNILDMVAAASIQLKEMGGVANSSEKKKGWINLMKPGNEEKEHWVPDEASTKCSACSTDFGAFVRRHHCRNCGDIFCDRCTQGRIALTAEEHAPPVRVCDRCMAEVTQRLGNRNDVAARASGFHSHGDLAKKLQEEMDKKSGAKTKPKFNERIGEVECPTCTVHLEVEVPTAGPQTVECNVCQHPFLVTHNSILSTCK